MLSHLEYTDRLAQALQKSTCPPASESYSLQSLSPTVTGSWPAHLSSISKIHLHQSWSGTWYLLPHHPAQCLTAFNPISYHSIRLIFVLSSNDHVSLLNKSLLMLSTYFRIESKFCVTTFWTLLSLSGPFSFLGSFLSVIVLLSMQSNLKTPERYCLSRDKVISTSDAFYPL